MNNTFIFSTPVSEDELARILRNKDEEEYEKFFHATIRRCDIFSIEICNPAKISLAERDMKQYILLCIAFKNTLKALHAMSSAKAASSNSLARMRFRLLGMRAFLKERNQLPWPE